VEEKGGGAQTRERFSSVEALDEEALEEALEEEARSFRVGGRRASKAAKGAAPAATLTLFFVTRTSIRMDRC
jgi:hypothetical protein